MRGERLLPPFFFCGLALVLAQSAQAHPEFQRYIQENSGRTVSCTMCHLHPDGPEGPKPGQIGSLSIQQLDQLNQARAAFEPGQNLENPLLNEFGNRILNELGKAQILTLRQTPAELAQALNPDVDTDGDGIPDARELVAGTNPVDPQHGEPWKLFWINMRRRAFHVTMILLATLLGLYGLNNLLKAFGRAATQKRQDDVTTHTAGR